MVGVSGLIVGEKVIVISASNYVSILELQPDENGSVLRDLQVMVGGYIEIVKPADVRAPYVIVCNEDGVIDRLAINKVGTMLYGAPLVGDIVIMKDGIRNGEPDIVGMSDDEATDLANRFVSICPWLKFLVHE